MVISGVVIAGKQHGRELGFPTVNIRIGKDAEDTSLSRNIVEAGVYAGWVYYQKKKWGAAIFIRSDQKLLEAHILNFDGDLYDKNIKVELGEKIRDPIKFDSQKMLRNQITKDVVKIRQVVYGKERLS